MFNSWVSLLLLSSLRNKTQHLAPRTPRARASHPAPRLAPQPAPRASRPAPRLAQDRQPILHEDEAGRLALNPRTHQLRRNFIFNRNFLGDTHSGYAIDYDDGKWPPAPWP